MKKIMKHKRLLTVWIVMAVLSVCFWYPAGMMAHAEKADVKVIFDENKGDYSEDNYEIYTSEDERYIYVTLPDEEPEWEGYVFEGWILQGAGETLYKSGEEVRVDITTTGVVVIFHGKWIEAGGEIDEIEEIDEGTYSLQKDCKYLLQDGTWMVEGDNSVYFGGTYFYVAEDGDYTFVRVQVDF